jgi:hypothetical protein
VGSNPTLSAICIYRLNASGNSEAIRVAVFAFGLLLQGEGGLPGKYNVEALFTR